LSKNNTQGQRSMEAAGLMTREQYNSAEHYLISRMQAILERETGHVIIAEPTPPTSGTSDDEEEENFDDPCVRTHSTERERALEEFRVYCNLCKKQRHCPKSYVGDTLRLGHEKLQLEMGKVAIRGDEIRASLPFVSCNLADFINDNGHFDLVGFLQLQKECFPTLFKMAVCVASVRTNEVGCEPFFSMAGYVSCPRRTRLNVRNYECLSALRSNMQQVYIDKQWVVDKYMMMEKTKSWDALEAESDLRVLELERELLAETLGVSLASMPAISSEDVLEVVDSDDEPT
jgi:hypothetical protein